MNRLDRRGASLAACSALFFLLALPLRSHDPITTRLTWTQEISRIVYKRCAGCHREGGGAMSLVTYTEARPWAKAIRDQVSTRRMPPWGAVAGVGDFAGDPSLTTTEIDMLIAWVEGGAPEGDPVYLPSRLPGPAVRPATPRYAKALRIFHETRLDAGAQLIALRPEGLTDGGSIECWAVLPDRQIARLIWLRDYRKQWTRDYVFHEPVRLPTGTRLEVRGTGHAALKAMLN